MPLRCTIPIHGVEVSTERICDCATLGSRRERSKSIRGREVGLTSAKIKVVNRASSSAESDVFDETDSERLIGEAKLAGGGDSDDRGVFDSSRYI